jgi:tetratricopeptide (TPR) repeat protein
LARCSRLVTCSAFPHYIRGLVELAQGRSEAALARFDREVHEGFRLQGRSLAQYALGRQKKSAAALRALIERYAHQGAVQIAELYAYRGEANLAFEWLERAYAQRDPGLIELKIDFLLRSLHADPRWELFLEKMKLAG